MPRRQFALGEAAHGELPGVRAHVPLVRAAGRIAPCTVGAFIGDRGATVIGPDLLCLFKLDLSLGGAYDVSMNLSP